MLWHIVGFVLGALSMLAAIKAHRTSIAWHGRRENLQRSHEP
jgi:hypothetical protein